MYLIFILPPLLIFFALILGRSFSAPGYKGPRNDHFNGTQFSNYDGIKAKGLLEVVKWVSSRDPGNWKLIGEAESGVPKDSEDQLTLYFVNHSTFLIQWKGRNILTDPVWSKRTSPLSFAGPRRLRPPGIKLEDLPSIDVVLLSHNHYDHLDKPTLLHLQDKYNPSFLVPLGVDLYLKNIGITKVEPLDWWKSSEHSGLNFEMVPAQHFSGRGMFDRDKTLWGGYMIGDNKEKLYFVGDTGYNQKMFDDIAEKHPVIDYALIPIGAYKPRWFMSPIHISPEEAVQVHQTLNIKRSVGMHYGTFALADDGQYEPHEDLQKALDKQNVDYSEFVILEEGRRFNF